MAAANTLHPPLGRDDLAEIRQLVEEVYWNGGQAEQLVKYCAQSGFAVTEHEAQLYLDDFEASLEQGADDGDGKPRPRMGRRLVLTAEEWENYEVPLESNYIIGSPENPIVRPETKNLILAPEKSFKTTFGL